MLFQIAVTFFTPVHRPRKLCRSSEHEFALHVHSLKKECCTWLCAFLPVSYRVQILGEKLCGIICKFDKKANQETVAQPNKPRCAVVTDRNVDQHSKKAILKVLIFLLYIKPLCTLCNVIKIMM